MAKFEADFVFEKLVLTESLDFPNPPHQTSKLLTHQKSRSFFNQKIKPINFDFVSLSFGVGSGKKTKKPVSFETGFFIIEEINYASTSNGSIET